MTGFSERLSAIKAKQEETDTQKREAAERAAESARSERESARSELISRREKLAEEFNEAEKTAGEANQAVLEADAFVQEQGDSIDPEVAEEIAAMKAEAVEAVKKFDELKSQLESVSEEIRTFEESDVDGAGPENSESIEAGTSPQVESSEDLESLRTELEGAREKESALQEEVAELIKIKEANSKAQQELGASSDVLVGYQEMYNQPGGEREKYLTMVEESEELAELQRIYDYAHSNHRRSNIAEWKYSPAGKKEAAEEFEIAEKNLNDYIDTMKSGGHIPFRDPVNRDSKPVILFGDLHGARFALNTGRMTLGELFNVSENQASESIAEIQQELEEVHKDIIGLEGRLGQNAQEQV